MFRILTSDITHSQRLADTSPHCPPAGLGLETICGVSRCQVQFGVLAPELHAAGKWDFLPTDFGTSVSWETSGNPAPGDEKGWVQYNVEGNPPVRLDFYSSASGSTKCEVTPSGGGTCHAGIGYNATFTYTLRLNN